MLSTNSNIYERLLINSRLIRKEVLVGNLLLNLLLIFSITDLFVQDATERRVTARHRSHLIKGNQVCKQ